MAEKRLTPALISGEHPNQDLESLTKLSFSKRAFTQIVGLDVCKNLTRLDLSNNNLTSIQGLSLCSNLKWLSVAGNCIQSLKGVESLSKLTVLNASHNEIVSIDEVSSLPEMCALILNNNEISTVCKLDKLTNLNTLVLSHNPIHELGKSLRKLSLLRKLSMSYCHLQTIGSSLEYNGALKELRLAHNQIMSLPLQFEKQAKLQILDLGHNHLCHWSDIQVLCNLHDLSNLNLHGNPICEHRHYREKIKELLPGLTILDAHAMENSQSHSSKPTLKKKAVSGSSKKRERDIHEKKDDVSKSESDEDKPFINLIASSASNTTRKKTNSEDSNLEPVVKEKTDSGVVAVLDGTKKRNEYRKRFQSTQKAILQSLTGIEVGTGGPSAWDSDAAASNVQASKGEKTIQSQTLYRLSSSSYSRWRLKVPKPNHLTT